METTTNEALRAERDNLWDLYQIELAKYAAGQYSPRVTRMVLENKIEALNEKLGVQGWDL